MRCDICGDLLKSRKYKNSHCVVCGVKNIAYVCNECKIR